VRTLTLVKDDGSQMVVDRFDIIPYVPEPTAITGQASGLCVGTVGATNADSTQLTLQNCDADASEQWTFVNGTVEANGKCMDVRGATPDASPDLHLQRRRRTAVDTRPADRRAASLRQVPRRR
jgi:hypothetical protein